MYTKLNSKGFSHDAVALLVVVMFAIAGVAYIVATHAQSGSGKPDMTDIVSVSNSLPEPAFSLSSNDAVVQADLSSAQASQRMRIRSIVMGQGSVHESPMGSNCIPGNPYGSNCQEWCVYFATWVWRRAGINVSSFQGSAQYLKSWAVFHHLWHGRTNANPHTGDIAIFGNGNFEAHVAIVVDSSHFKIRMVGGNLYDKVAWHRSTHGTYWDYSQNFKVSGGYGIEGFISPP